ncbi:MAG: NADH dehydrogenase subunit M [Candidatus Xenobia bacterium]|jgi:NADH-quinone oxidoreductase subunit M
MSDWPVLSLMVWAPLLGAILILGSPACWVKGIQRLGVVFASLPLLLALPMYVNFWQAPATGYRWVEDVLWFAPLNIHYKLGVDGLSMPMLLLSGIVCCTAAFISLQIDFRHREYFALALTAMTGVLGVFATTDLFFLILFYELASIPMFFLVGIWGSDKSGDGKPIHRRQAAMKLLVYLQLGGGLVLIGILGLYFLSAQYSPNQTFSFDLEVLRQIPLPIEAQKILFLIFFIGFGIEAGLVPFHTWLPEGHSSAPTALSMLLAGVLLKMGGYGIVRLGFDLCPQAVADWMPIFAAVAVVNVLYGGLCALRQSDIKVMIAYSSVSHMGMVFLGLAAMTGESRSALFGLTGAVFQMFSHGIITALLFALAGTVYHITHSRNLKQWGGLAARMPFLATLFAVGAMGSLGLPGMTGFAAELMVFLGSWPARPGLTALAICGLVITTTYMLRSLGYGFFGPLNPRLIGVRDALWWERLPLMLLALTTLAFGFYPVLLTAVTSPTLQDLVNRV